MLGRWALMRREGVKLTFPWRIYKGSWGGDAIVVIGEMSEGGLWLCSTCQLPHGQRNLD